MNNIRTLTDKAAISLSLLCAMHCLALPLAIVLLPSLAALPLNNEAFHIWMIIAVIPTSIYALSMGCKQHKNYNLLILGLLGIAFLVLAIFSGQTFLSTLFDHEIMEKTLTTIGATIIAYGHYRNYQLCKDQEPCDCSVPKNA